MQQSNKTKKMFLVILLTIFIFAAFATTVFAESDKCVLCGATHDLDKITATQRTAYRMNNIVYGGQLFDDDGGDEDKITTVEALRFDITQGDFVDLWGTAENFYKKMEVFGIMLVCIYSLIETLAHLSHDTLTPEHLVKEIMKLTIAVIVVLNGFEIAAGVIDLSTSTFDAISSVTETTTGNSKNCVYGLFDKMSDPVIAIIGDLLAIVHMFTLVIPWLILMIAKGIIAVTCWARVLELITRVIFAPIGISDLFVYGTRSNGVKYLKKIFVCAFQGAVILAMSQAYFIILSNMSAGVGQWIVMVIMAIVMLSSASKAKTFASEICGI